MNLRKKQVVMLLAKWYEANPRARNEAETLTSAGYDVTVLSWDRLGIEPREISVNGVTVRSLRLLRGTEFSKVSYALSAFMLQVYCLVWCLRHMNHRYVLHSHDLGTLVAGVMLRILRPKHVKLVYDCHELTPAVYAEWYGFGVGLVAGELERKLLRFADSVITVNPPIQNYLSEITGKRASVIFNTVKPESVPPEDKTWWKKKLGLNGFIVSYVGTLRQGVALDELMDAAASMSDMNVKGTKFVIVGLGPELSRIKNKASNLTDSVVFVPRVPHLEALGYVKASDVSYAVYRTQTDSQEPNEYNRLVSGNSMVASPWKVFEAMACGTCVLVRKGTYTWTLVESLGFGISAGSGTGIEIADSLSWAFQNQAMIESMGNSARKHFIDEYNWDRMAKRLVELYGELA